MTEGQGRRPRRERGDDFRSNRVWRENLSPKYGRIDRGRSGEPQRRPYGAPLRGLGKEHRVYALALSGGWRTAFRLR